MPGIEKTIGRPLNKAKKLSTQSSISFHTFNTYNKTKKRRPEDHPARRSSRNYKLHRYGGEYTQYPKRQPTSAAFLTSATNETIDTATNTLVVRCSNRRPRRIRITPRTTSPP
ncbi:hypothetical protein QTP88_017513 [Uroleucon formosanum]